MRRLQFLLLTRKVPRYERGHQGKQIIHSVYEKNCIFCGNCRSNVTKDKMQAFSINSFKEFHYDLTSKGIVALPIIGNLITHTFKLGTEGNTIMLPERLIQREYWQ
ncbi:hypothetical protein PR048_011940 [Dryococelus australis]|uniref:Uncharacterized protein n=1 Tax=Dryococelus australis TaxID=614101 RepID=A0ABQ9HN80_9NEOP|nr:hypothetical protein PR048_011940 [Dryococelus australis]